MHKGPQILLWSTSGKRLARCLGHPSSHKRELVPSRARQQHPLLLPRCAGAPSPPPFHRQGKKVTTHTHTHEPDFFCGGPSTTSPRASTQERRAASEAQSCAGGSGRKPTPSAPPPGEGKGFVTKPSEKTHLRGSGKCRPGSSCGCRGRAAQLPRLARREHQREAEELPSPGASSQLAKKASPRQSCLTIKGARPRHS